MLIGATHFDNIFYISCIKITLKKIKSVADKNGDFYRRV